jgi:transcriptional regulator with XRE-family HTH domain
MPSVGTFFRERRKAVDLNQTEVGRRVGVSQNMVSRWENDQARPDGTHLARLLEVLDIDPDDYAALVHENIIGHAIEHLAVAIEELARRFGTGPSLLALGAGLLVQPLQVPVDTVDLRRETMTVTVQDGDDGTVTGPSRDLGGLGPGLDPRRDSRMA